MSTVPALCGAGGRGGAAASEVRVQAAVATGEALVRASSSSRAAAPTGSPATRGRPAPPPERGAAESALQAAGVQIHVAENAASRRIADLERRLSDLERKFEQMSKLPEILEPAARPSNAEYVEPGARPSNAEYVPRRATPVKSSPR